MAEPPTPQQVELCVFCRRHRVEPAWRPFCSKRCRTQDLARWADESYRVPGELCEPSENAELGEPSENAEPGEPDENDEKVTDPDG